MPRLPRIDFPGALHHVMARGIERREIFRDDADRTEFGEIRGRALTTSGTPCYAWAFLPNHVHLLLVTGKRPLHQVLHAALFRYAAYFNRRHRRVGHLFQNRYKSILCERDAYFQELVRYLHLNPVRAGLVETPGALARHPWCGHGARLGRVAVPWQDTRTVLALFGPRVGAAREAYQRFVVDGFTQGRRPELVGGGLVRSLGGWRALVAARREGRQERGDSRILGSGDFVDKVLRDADERLAHDVQRRREGWTPARGLARGVAGAGGPGARAPGLTAAFPDSRGIGLDTQPRKTYASQAKHT